MPESFKTTEWPTAIRKRSNEMYCPKSFRFRAHSNSRRVAYPIASSPSMDGQRDGRLWLISLTDAKQSPSAVLPFRVSIQNYTPFPFSLEYLLCPFLSADSRLAVFQAD